MKTINLIQGSDEWKTHRARHFNASDAPTMLGISQYKTRAQLIQEMATGIIPDVDSVTQNRFDQGHEAESRARPLAEQIVGEELYPVVGVNGKYSASFDGITFDETMCFEHKYLNNDLMQVKTADDLHEQYRAQMEHQLMVSGADKCLFMASRWDGEVCTDQIHVWYFPDQVLRERIRAGWEQFEKDVNEYRHTEAKPGVIGRAPDALPALRIEVTGMVTASNLAEFKAHAMAVFGGIKTDLQTDEDFADADKTTKWCKDVEERLDAAKQHALSQTTSIDELFRALDAIKEEARQKRLTLEKLVKSRKDSIRIEKCTQARTAFGAHYKSLEESIKPIALMFEMPNFGDAIKGLKSISSIDNALETALANAKIASSALATDIRAKLDWCRENAAGKHALFPDLQQIIYKPREDFELTITSRIEKQAAEEAAKLEAERERIRQEEAAKLVVAQTPAPVMAQQPVESVTLPFSSAVATRNSPTLKLGVINERLGFNVTAEFLMTLGFVAQVDRSAKLYHESDFSHICRAIAKHVNAVAAIQHQLAA